MDLEFRQAVEDRDKSSSVMTMASSRCLPMALRHVARTGDGRRTTPDPVVVMNIDFKCLKPPVFEQYSQPARRGGPNAESYLHNYDHMFII